MKPYQHKSYFKSANAKYSSGNSNNESLFDFILANTDNVFKNINNTDDYFRIKFFPDFKLKYTRFIADNLLTLESKKFNISSTDNKHDFPYPLLDNTIMECQGVEESNEDQTSQKLLKEDILNLELSIRNSNKIKEISKYYSPSKSKIILLTKLSRW